MRGVYTVSFDQQSITNANGDHDFFEIDAASEKPVELVGVTLDNKSEVGDAQEEMVAWSIEKFSGGTFTSGNGTSTTPRPTDPHDQAASFAAETVASTIATTTGTKTTHPCGTFNIRTGLQVILPPDMRQKIDGAANSAMVVRLLTALADDATFSGHVTIREL